MCKKKKSVQLTLSNLAWDQIFEIGESASEPSVKQGLQFIMELVVQPSSPSASCVFHLLLAALF